jgi:hypothetical protein
VHFDQTTSCSGGSDVELEIAPDKLELGLKCDSLDLDSPASWYVTIRSGGGLLETLPAVREQ